MAYRARHLYQRKNVVKSAAAFLMAVVMITSAFLPDNFTGLSSGKVMAAEGDDGGLSEHIINTVSPNHVKFNLFDYWIIEKDTSSANSNRLIQGGINNGHSFIFGGLDGWGPWNVWTGNHGHFNMQGNNPGIRYGQYEGIVGNLLQDDYPVLSLYDDYYERGQQPDFINLYGLTGTLQESLAYLFDPDMPNDYKAVYENVQDLVKYDGNGGYTYNSHENYAVFQPSAEGTLGTNGESSDGYFEVYDNWGLLGGTSPNGQFFPFDSAEEVFKKDANGNYETENGLLVSQDRHPTSASEAEGLNHFMGLTMETVFLQPEDGKIDADTPMSFTFSGDDDVWIFIDNVLVSDLGGVHDECFTIIDFETGIVYTGMTPIVQNNDGTFSEDIPTVQELRTAKTDGKTWNWYDRNPVNLDQPYGDKKGPQSGSYADFVAAHGIKEQTLKDIFTAVGQDGYQTWGDGTADGMNSNTFDQNTQHELKMFYLERGAGASNLVLAFNMLAVPASGITKTDQDGRPVAGAEFSLWPAQLSEDETNTDEYGNRAPAIDPETGLYIADKSDRSPICTATTDENGHLSFVTENRKIISFQERARENEFYYVLEETGRPTGYRTKGDISLYYSMYNTTTRDGVLLSYNYWQTGAYTQAILDVTMTEELYEYTLDEKGEATVGNRIVPYTGASEQEITEYLDNGIIFAVPVKRMDMSESIYDESNLNALYGTTNIGWTLMTNSIEDKSSVLEAAKQMMRVMQETRQTGTIIAERNARQQFQVTITNIPGDVKLSYPYLLDSGDVDESLHNIAFYFAPNAETLDDIEDASTIVRLSTVTPDYAGSSDRENRFVRQYASQFYVANILNRVRVQKLDYYGDRLENATFNLYQTYSTWQRDGYMLVEEGSADTAHIGMYRNPAVVDENGELKDRTEILSDEVKAWDIGTTLSEGSAGVGGLDLEGSIIFPSKFDTYIYGSQTEPYRVNPNDTSTYIEEGEYVILEVKSPSDGYLVNETPIVVTVNDDGVFADAGEVNDGVRVGQYAGWVLNSMSHFAAESAVDETLTFLSTTLQVQDGNGGLTSPVEGDITWLNKFSNENHRYIFLAEDVGRYVTSGRNLYQYTDAGIPQLQIKQNSYVEARVIILDGNYYAEYHGPVTVNKTNLVDNSTYTLRGNATNGTLAFWLRKAEAEGGGQTLKSVEIDGQVLTEGKDYHVYTPNVTDLSDTDISGLFSVETLVQVYDQSVGNLEVSKETEAVAPGSAADEELFFYRVYSVYEHATRIALAETDENGEVKVNADGTPVLNKEFTGTLNVRLRQILEDATTQMTATNVAVKFTNGVGLIYLEPSYSVEHIYIPENENHPAHGLVGVVEIRITLDDTVSGTAQETGRHIAFDIEHNHTIRFTDGVGILYHDPTFVIETVELGDITYYANPADGQKGFEATSRFNYANIEQVQNLSANSEVSVTFTEADGTSSSQERVVTKVDNSNVTVKSDDNGGYKLEYNLLSDTNEQAVVGQFALHAGQRIHIEGLSGGTVYYIYEYAAGSGEEAGRTELLDEWTTEIKITPQGVNEGSEPIDDHYDEVIQDELPEYRAARGIIRPNATQRVDFTNTGRVGQLTISKAVTGAQATENDRQTTFSFTVTLKDKDGTPLKGTYSYTGSAIDGVEKPADGTLKLNNGTATFTLRHGQSITIQDIPKEASYEVAESDNSGYTTTVEGDGDADGTIKENTASHVAFTNMKLSTFAFTKVASENHRQVLPGAKFMLFRLQCTDGSHDHSQVINPDNPGNCWECVDAQTSGDDGGVSFQGLSPNNEYRLVETKAPDGRVLPAGQWRITTNAENELTIEAVDDGSQRPPAFATDNGNRILPNMRPIDIPSSGGFGAWPFLLVGGLLMLTALGIILVKKSRGNYTASK